MSMFICPLKFNTSPLNDGSALKREFGSIPVRIEDIAQTYPMYSPVLAKFESLLQDDFPIC